MHTRIYQLTGAVPDMSTEEIISTAEHTLIQRVVPNTRFSHVKRTDAPPESLQSDAGRAYITSAFDNTQATVESNLETLKNTLCSDESIAVDVLLNHSQARNAAFVLGQDRGTATYLYTPSGWGIRTQDELDEFIEHNDVTGNDNDEYFAVVPFRGKH